MSHPEQMAFMRLCRDHLCRDTDEKFLEIGSYNVNNDFGTIRELFAGAKSYVGVDLTDGPNVDVVGSGHEVDFGDDHFDVSLSCECFEHNPEWVATLNNMWRMTKPGGLVIITVATTGRVEHGTRRTMLRSSPGTAAVKWNYYRNLTERDFRKRFNLDEMFDEYHFYVVASSHDLYFWGIKRGGSKKRTVDRQGIEAGISRASEDRKATMTPLGWVARMCARAPLKVFAKALPDPAYQHVAVPYSRLCYALVRKLGIPIEHDGFRAVRKRQY